MPHQIRPLPTIPRAQNFCREHIKRHIMQQTIWHDDQLICMHRNCGNSIPSSSASPGHQCPFHARQRLEGSGNDQYFNPEELKFIDIGIVSEEYFLYAQHLYDQVSLLATPEDVYSNIEGGFGIFAGYASLTFVVDTKVSFQC